MCLAVPGKLIQRYQHHQVQMGIVDFGGIEREVCLAHVADAVVGDYLIVHVGFALSILDQAQAELLQQQLRQLHQGSST